MLDKIQRMLIISLYRQATREHYSIRLLCKKTSTLLFVSVSGLLASSTSYYLQATYSTFYYLNQTCILISLKIELLS